MGKTSMNSSDRQALRRLIDEMLGLSDIGQRIRHLSSFWLGAPYIVNPLIGSPAEPEELVARVDGFDCVTFLETLLALAEAESVEEFLANLRQIRYRKGEVQWKTRLHYTTDWARHLIEQGRLRELTRGPGTVERFKELSLLAGMSPKTSRFRYFPKKKIPSLSRRLKDGDFIYFVSTRKGLDVFHVGLLVWDGERLLLRHAARSRGSVVEQELSEFVKANRMSGVIVNRPLATRGILNTKVRKA